MSPANEYGELTEHKPDRTDGGDADQGGGGSRLIRALAAPMFRSLRNRNFRLFTAGSLVSNTGTWMQRVAQDWLMLELSHNSGTALGITTGLQFLPMMLFGLWGGVIADRYSKRRVLVITQAAMGLLALILGLLDLTGSARLWQVYLLAFALGVATVVDNPARQTFVVEMVGRTDLPNAIALGGACFNIGRVLGPAVAGLLIAVIGTGPVFLVNAASFVAVLVSLAFMRADELRTAEPVARTKGQLLEGLRYVRARRELVMVLVVLGFVATFGMNLGIITPLIAKKVFHSGASAFGLASTMQAVGALIGALVAARRVGPNRRLLIGSAVLFGVLEMAASLMPSYWLFLVLLVPTGVAMLTFTTTSNATMQLGVTAAMRGRVMALYMLVILGTNPLGAPLIGKLAELIGPRYTMTLGGAVAALVPLLVAAVMLPRETPAGAAADLTDPSH
ncbi:MFS transporter [Actinoallomurus sp. NPDC052308]|uniref:MFS transporter n=1 Tax=Actinoallomurus sp. NPDC052308 TaxID=3155530 RepID=UPI00344A16CE